MSIWSSGSEQFNASIQKITSATPLEDLSQPLAKDTIILDLETTKIPDVFGAVKLFAERGCTVVVACQPASMPMAVESVKVGATQIVLKPVKAEDLTAYLDRPTRSSPKSEDIIAWREKYAPEIIGDSPAIFEALEIAARAAEFDCPVLITGESGTGKELLARAFHRGSPRGNSTFIPVNCPAIPKELVESELFGHAKGAFTGATMARMGRFEAADNGTLFLDEIGEMELGIQSKLLRALQEYQITRVGESRSLQVNVRIIAATNRNLEEMSARGLFREDLFYRLNVVQVHLPALRERREDIPLLIEAFLNKLSVQLKLTPPQFSYEALDALVAYHWPGNIRQLHNTIERLVILQRGRTVELKDLPISIKHQPKNRVDTTPRPDFRFPENPAEPRPLTGSHPALNPAEDDSEQDFEAADETLEVDENEAAMFAQMQLPPDGIDLRVALQRFEDSMIKQALMQTRGNKNQAAKILGLNRTTLVEKLRKRSSTTAA